MRINKLIIGLFLITISPLGWSSSDDFPKKTIAIMTDCYNQSVKKGKYASECIKRNIKNIPNPLNYYVRIQASEKDKQGNFKIRMVMINKMGFMIYCLGKANKTTLVVQSCASEQGTPPTISQELLINLF